MSGKASAEEAVLERFRHKCRMAGGARPGFVLRRRAVLWVQDEHPGLDLEAGIAALLERGFLKASEDGRFLFLTAAAAEHLAPEAPAASTS